jgi:hypothetical protein
MSKNQTPISRQDTAVLLFIAGIGSVLLLCLGLISYATSSGKKIGPAVDPNLCEYCGNKTNKSENLAQLSNREENHQ